MMPRLTSAKSAPAWQTLSSTTQDDVWEMLAGLVGIGLEKSVSVTVHDMQGHDQFQASVSAVGILGVADGDVAHDKFGVHAS